MNLKQAIIGRLPGGTSLTFHAFMRKYNGNQGLRAIRSRNLAERISKQRTIVQWIPFVRVV